MKPSTWQTTMMALVLPLSGWGQPIVFDTVHFNPVNSFLLATTIHEIEGGYLAFGIGGDGTGAVQDQRTFRFDSTGGLVETKVFQNSRLTDNGAFGPVARCQSGGFVSGLSEFGNGEWLTDLYMYRYDELGDTLWTRHLLTDTTLAIRKCIETVSGEVVMVGLHEFPKGAFMFRLTAAGDSIAFVNFGFPPFYAMSVVEDNEQNLCIAGFTDTADPSFEDRGCVLKCTSTGEVLWFRTRPSKSGFNGLIQTEDGGILAFGGYRNALNLRGVHLVKYDAGGTEQWVRNNIIFADAETRSCTFTNGFQQPDGSFIICGSLRNTALGLADKGMLYKFDEEGNEIWSRFYSHYDGLPPGYPQLFKDVKQTADGGFILTGETEGPTPPNSHRLWLLKLDSVGCLVPGCNSVGVEEYESQLQSALRVSPNPASEQVTVDLALREDYRLEGTVQLMLLDAQGKEVLRRTIGASVAQLRANVDLSAYPSGLYYVHLRDDRKWLAGGTVVIE